MAFEPNAPQNLQRKINTQLYVNNLKTDIQDLSVLIQWCEVV